MFMNSIDYEVEFMSAVKRSQEWNLDIQHDIKISRMLSLDSKRCELVFSLLHELSFGYREWGDKKERFKYTSLAKNRLEEVLKVPLYYTIGYVELNRFPILHTVDSELKSKEINPSLNIESSDLHSWLTTPGMEVIDIFYNPPSGVGNNDASVAGCYFFQCNSKFNEGVIYHPQFIGDDYLKRISDISGLSFES
jgi:hypothetical protein